MGEHHAGTTFCDWLFCHAEVTGVSLLGIIAALVVATAIMFLGGMLALMIKLLPWLLLAIAVVWVIKAIKAPKVPKYQRYDRWRY
ncbi:phage shock protein G [Escherichia coli]|nr:phage shock protein G [Escherichia coli]